jgi:regulatory protein
MGDRTPDREDDRDRPLERDDDRDRALELAYAHLNRRERTEAELRRHLEARGVDLATVAATVHTLRDQGYLDDARYARLFAQDKRELEQWGNERIRRTLLEHGVERELVEATLTQAPPEDELDRARAVLRRRFPSPLLDRRDRDRALGVLLRKGFDCELALEALADHAPDALP